MDDKPLYGTKGLQEKADPKDVEKYKKQEPWEIEKKIRGFFGDPMAKALENKKEKPFGS